MSKHDARLELVFIESDVADLDVLLADIGPGKEVHVLDADADGLEQIAAILQGRSGIDAIHLFSHGAQGAVQLGTLTLTSANLPDHAANLEIIGSTLSADADILLYGCNVAAGSSGAALVDALARATQADIAASIDLTGAAAQGGDWELENSTGPIESTPLVAPHYDHVADINTAPIVLADPNPPGTTITASAGDLSGRAVLVQDSGKLIVVGDDNGGDVKLLRYNADGTLDTTFGTSGFVTTNVSGYDSAYAATLQSDGKIVVTATVNSNTDWALVRYNADGTLDTGFGGGQGHVVTDLNASSQDQALSMALQNDGKILVAGNSYSTTYGYQLAVARYNADGTLDTSFGSDGKFYYNATGSTRGDQAFGIAVQEDSETPGNRKIVVVGQSETGSGTYDVVTLRLNDNGAFDASFDIDGVAITDIGPDDRGNAVAVQNDGKVVVAGTAQSSHLLLRYNSDGTLDTAFGTSGIVNDVGEGTAAGNAVKVTSDGKILVGGTAINSMADGDFTVWRYDADGTPDTSFGGGDGLATHNFGMSYTADVVNSLAIQSDGKLVAVGTTADLSNYYRIGLVRFNSDGTLDSGFGNSEGLTYTVGDTPVPLSAWVADAEMENAGSYAGMTLTLQRQGGANTHDLFGASNLYGGFGGLKGSLSEGSDLIIDYGMEYTFGTVTQNSGGTLVLTFANDINYGGTDRSILGLILSQLTFSTTAASSPAQLEWSFNDNDGGSPQIGTGITTVNVIASDTTAPAFDVAPAALSPTIDGFTPSASIDEAGTVYYVVVPGGADAPSVAQVIDGLTSTGDMALSSGSAMVGSAPFTTQFLPITWLGANTAYDIYFVAKDSAGNQQAVVTKVSATTAAPPAAPSTPDLAAGSDSGQSSSDNVTNDTTPTFTGTAEVGSTVKLYDTDGSTVLGSTTATDGTWSITTSTLSGGTHTISAKAENAGGGASDASAGLEVAIDTTAPTLSITSNKSALKAGETATITFTFSEDPGATFSAGDLVVSGGTLGAIGGTGTTRTATFTPSANTNSGTASITVAAGTYFDAAGNSGGAGTTPSLTFDTKAPTLTITSDQSTLKAGETATITFTFSEDPGATFSWNGTSGDLNVSGGTLGAISGSGLTRTATFTPSADTDGGAASITASAGSYTDAAGNKGGPGTAPSLSFDTLAPDAPATLTLDPASDLGNSSSDALTSDTTPTITGTAEIGSTVTLLDGSTVLGTTTADGKGAWSITSSALAEGQHTLTATATDAAGNTGAASSGLDVSIDATAPTLAITSDKNVLKAGETATLTFTFSEDPGATFTWNGKAGDIAVSGGTLGAISGSGTTRTATFTPGADTDNGKASISVAAGTYADAAGNSGGAGTTPSLSFDTLAPTLTITSDKSALKAGDTATITFTFSEDPGSSFAWDGASGDITVSGGTLSAITGSGTTRTATFTPGADTDGGSASITVAAGTYTDSAGNKGAAGMTPSLSFDTLAPAAPAVLALDPASDLGHADSDALTSDTTPTITGTAEIGATVTLLDGSTVLGTTTADGKGAWSITSSALAEGQRTLTATATDAAGNTGAASSGLEVSIDVTAPTLVISSDESALKAGETATLTFTFSEDPGTSFTWDGKAGDVSISGGTLGAISDSGLTRTATFTPTADFEGSAGIKVASTWTDAAGNTGGAAFGDIEVDTKAPTLTITSDKSALKAGDTATLTFTFSEDPGATFADGDITVAGGILGALSGSGAVRTATFTPTADIAAGSAGIAVDGGSYADAAGNDGASGKLGLTYDTLVPVISAAAAATPDGSYGAGATITVQLSFSEAVNVTGAPQLSLETGAIDRVLDYTGGNGTDTLTFSYTVQDGDANSDLDYTGAGALNLNGGSILDLNGNAAALTLAAPGAAGSLGANAALVIDAVAPVFASANVNGSTLTLSYTDAHELDAAQPPAPGSFGVMKGMTAIAVTGITVDAAARKLTLTLGTAVAQGDVVTLSYTDPGSGNDTQAIQDSLGNDAASLVAVAVTNATPPEEDGAGSGDTTTVDGVDVETSTITEGGITQTVVTITPVSPSRVEDANTPNGALADIPLALDADNETLLQIGLPVGVGVTAAGSTSVADTSLGLRAQLIAASQPRLTDTAFTQVLQDGIDRYVGIVEAPSQVTVRTLTLTQEGSAPTQPIVITGAQGTGEDNQAHPLRQEALVIDARGLPQGSVLELDQVEFAVVVGNVTVLGGEGRNYVFGDDGAQTIFLGAGDDELHGGGGDDRVASNEGDDRLFGDAGNDLVVGGIGADVLDGGAGDDVLQGGGSNAGTWSFGIGADGRLLTHFIPPQSTLATSSDRLGTSWAYDPVSGLLADSRLAFVDAPADHLARVASLFKAVTQRLPTLAELNQLAALGQDPHQLAELAHTAYARKYPVPADAAEEARMLITQVLGADAATPDLVQRGVEFFQNGGARSEALLYLVNDARFKAGMRDADGVLHLAQDYQAGELDWGSASGNDTLYGGEGNDVLIGGSGGDLLDGGAGHDTAVLKLSAADYVLSPGSADSGPRFMLENQVTGEIDVLIDIEFLQFGDAVFALEIPDDPGSPQLPLADFLRPATGDELMLIGVHDLA